jgi:hypothetical protein
MLIVTNVTDIMCKLNFLLQATLAMMDIFFNGYKRKDSDHEAGYS